MEVRLEGIARKFNRQKVFSNLSYTFEQGGTYAILGGNGSGKSTLIKTVLGALGTSKGKIHYYSNGTSVHPNDAPYRISIAAPYLELIEELTALEFLRFHLKFKNFTAGLTPPSLLKLARLEEARDKQIRNFSSGMKQRLRLALALGSDVSLILLDEPSSNLDPAGMEWYKKLIQEYRQDRTILVGSNFNETEIHFCEHQLEIKNYK